MPMAQKEMVLVPTVVHHHSHHHVGSRFWWKVRLLGQSEVFEALRYDMMRSLLLLAVSSASADSNGLGFNMHYTAPEGAGTYPVILFVSGFSGLAPVFTYSKFVAELSKKGYIVVGMDHVKLPNYPAQGKAFHDIMEWVKAGNLSQALKDAKISATLDLDRVAVMGQSAGNHVVGQGLTDGCSLAKAQILIDPVDGFDPFGFVHSEDLP